MPDIGRWGIIDPWTEKTFELYSYVYNNPVRLIDPTGMEGEESSGGGSGETGAGGDQVDIGLGGITISRSTAAINSYYYGDSADTTSKSSEKKASATNNAAIHAAGLNAVGEHSVTDPFSTTQNCCPDPTLVFNLAKGFTISAGAVALAVGYAANNIFSSAHVPVWAGKAYGLSGGTFTISDIRLEARTIPVQERMGQPGSYTILFSNDQKYHGKGPIDRMFTSAIYQMGIHQTTVKSFNWSPSATDREAFKAEYRRMQTDVTRQYPQGYRNPINYNIRQSPGYIYTLQDGY